MKVKRKLLPSLVFSILFICCAAVSEREPHTFNEPEILAEFAIAKSEDIILLPVDFKGEEHLFIFDTGCSWVAFDNSFKDLLGNVKRNEMAKTHGKPVVVEFFDAPEVFLGPINMGDCDEVICIDLNSISLALGKKVGGLIGMNFLRNHVVQINFDEGRLLFLHSKKGAENGWGEKLPIKYNSGGIPQIKGNVDNGGKTYFIIDTGASFAKRLESKIFRNIQKHKNKARSSEQLDQVTPPTPQYGEIRIDKLSIGQLKYEGLIFCEGRVSVLGPEFLSRHIVTFDFLRNAVYFKKGKDFQRIDEADMSGLHLIRISNKTIVHSVDEDSPAHKAGFKANDIVLKINGKDAEAYTRWEISRLKKSGDKHKVMMTIKRGDEIQEITFHLQKRI